MAEVLTTTFKTDSVRKFVEDAKTSDYYVFVSGIESVTPINAIASENEFLSKVLFGKKIRTFDMHYMIRYYPWQTGEVYVQYDDIVDLEDEKFYAVVGPNQNDSGSYQVFKCLFNNYGNTCNDPPKYTEQIGVGVYTTADNYKWQYMYSIPQVEFNAYNLLGYIPIVGNFTVDPVSSTGGSPLSDIIISNPSSNVGYQTVSGSLNGPPFSGGVLQVNTNSSWSPVTNYYTGQTIYFINAGGENGDAYVIDTYVYDGLNNKATITVIDNFPDQPTYGLPHNTANPLFDNISADASFTISPTIELLGDGTGARAIPVVSSTGTIYDTIILEKGSGYNTISARVVDPAFDFVPEDPTTTDIRAEIRAVLSPKDGHASDLLDELRCRHALLYGYITGDDNAQIGATNTYNGVGIVKDPEFDPALVNPPEVFDNRIAVVTDNYNLTAVDQIVTQVNQYGQTTFSGVVHEIDESSNTVYIAEYSNLYPNQPGETTAFDITLNLLNTASETIAINTPIVDNVTFSDYIQRTGKVYYMEDFFPLSRTALSREEFKILFEY